MSNINEIQKDLVQIQGLLNITTDQWKIKTGDPRAQQIDKDINNIAQQIYNTNQAWVFIEGLTNEILINWMKSLNYSPGSKEWNYVCNRKISTLLSKHDEVLIRQHLTNVGHIQQYNKYISDCNIGNIEFDIKSTQLPKEFDNYQFIQELKLPFIDGDKLTKLVEFYYYNQGSERYKINNRFFIIHCHDYKNNWKDSINFRCQIINKNIAFNNFINYIINNISQINEYNIINQKDINNTVFKVKVILFFLIENPDKTLSFVVY